MYTSVVISGRVEHLAVHLMNKGKFSLGCGQCGVGGTHPQLYLGKRIVNTMIH